MARLPLRTALAALLLLPVLDLPAGAQSGPRSLGGPGSSGNVPGLRPQAPAPTPEAPPALPGARVGRVPVIPPTTPPEAMNPNDALFDAIARGDLPAVRDAVQRGADLQARNALGLTAIDASVDRARTDITFYLLSVRGVAGIGSSGPPPEAEAPRGRAPRPAPEPRAARAEPRAAVPQPSRDGGTPIPSIGFLGFDPRG